MLTLSLVGHLEGVKQGQKGTSWNIRKTVLEMMAPQETARENWPRWGDVGLSHGALMAANRVKDLLFVTS